MRNLAYIALIGGVLLARPAAAQGFEGCYIESFTPDGMPNYNCDRRNNQRPAAPEPDVWGAIAVSPSQLASGNSWGFKSEADAAKRALTECRARASDCKVVTTVADVCASLVTSLPEKVFTVGGPTGAANYADGNGLLKCERAGGKSCTVIYSFCADGVRHVLGTYKYNPPRRN